MTHGLDAAVALHRSAVAGTRDDGLLQAVRLANLTNSLTERFQLTGRSEDITEAITAGRRAVELVVDSAPQFYPQMVSNLGYALRCRYTSGGDAKDAAEAIRCAGEVLRSSPDGHPERAKYHTNLGFCYSARSMREDDSSDADRALACFREGARAVTSPARERIGAAEAWGSVAAARVDWITAVEAYRTAVELLPRVAWRGVSRLSREVALSSTSDVAADAAAMCLNLGAPTDAIPLLEQGRAVLWAQHLEARADLRVLAASHERLANRLAEIRLELR